MSRIIFQKEYMILFPSFVRAQVHKHPFMHLFVGSKTCQIVVNDEKVQGNRILLDSNVKHMVEPDHHCDFFLLIDHTSHVARQLRENYLQTVSYCQMEGQMMEMPENMVTLPEEEVVAGVEKLLASMGVTEQPSEGRDDRVRQVIEKLTSGEWLGYSVKELARAVYLSESRLTHLFKEEEGISLKSYILTRRLERAYRYVNAGGKITQAAQEAGFSGSAHLAYSCKKFTGVSISDVTN